MDPAGDAKGEAAVPRSQSCPPCRAWGPHHLWKGVFARPASRSPRAVMGLAGAARPPSQQPSASVGGFHRRRETSILLAAVGRLHGRAARGVLAAFLERDPVAADVLAAGLDAAALETVISGGRLAGRRPGAASTAEEAREVARGCWWARRAAAVGGRAAAVGGWPRPRSAASRPRRRSRLHKAAAAEEGAVAGLAGAAVGALLVRPNHRSAAWLARRRRARPRIASPRVQLNLLVFRESDRCSTVPTPRCGVARRLRRTRGCPGTRVPGRGVRGSRRGSVSWAEPRDDVSVIYIYIRRHNIFCIGTDSSVSLWL